MTNPRAVIAGLNVWHQLFEHLAGIADQCRVDRHILVDFSAVNLNVDLAGALGVGAQVTSDTVVKTHADGNKQVSFLYGVIHPRFAVHTHHAEVVRIVGREAADAEERHGDRIIAGADELLERAHRAGNHDAVASKNDGALGGIQHFDRAVEFGLIVIVANTLGRKFWRRRFPVEFRGSLLGVFGDVNKHRAGASAIGDQKGLADGARNVLGFCDYHVVLGDGHGDAGDIDFLKCVGAQNFAADLARNADDWRRVQHGGGDAGNHVRRAGPGRGHGDADSTAGSRVAIGHMRGALFVAYEDVMQLRFTERVVDRKYGATGIAEDFAHAESRERFAKNFRTGELHRVLVSGNREGGNAFKTG